MNKEIEPVTILNHSISSLHHEFIGYEWIYPRFIHAEIMTHRVLAKNASSSRAVPLKRMHELIRNNPAMPSRWEKNQSGMQSSIKLSDTEEQRARGLWLKAMEYALAIAEELADPEGINLHKQWVNRLTEPFQWMKTVISGTEWDNFYNLRADYEAQPEFFVLAHLAKQAHSKSTPILLKEGQWHLPYVHSEHKLDGTSEYYDTDGTKLTLEEALMVSTSCCAQASYRRLNDTKEEAIRIYHKLNLTRDNPKKHASPSEHQATPIDVGIGKNHSFKPETWSKGITHVTKDGVLGSGNLFGWIQHRQLI